MVLESILNPKNAEGRPLHVFVIAAIYTLIAMFFAHFLFPEQSSILSVAIISMLFIPFFQKLFAVEEKKERLIKDNKNFLTRHSNSIYMYSAFFAGVMLATAYVFVFFSGKTGVFLLQEQTLESFASGATIRTYTAGEFISNNTQVMVLTFILSILFGSGAILILAWNASVIGVFAGSFAKTLSPSIQPIGVPLALSSIAMHGIVEIVAYFLAGLAGGILSVGAIRERFGSKSFSTVLKDSIKMLALAETLIIVAAFIEAA